MSNSIKRFRRGITHAGIFHSDDIVSTAFLLELNPDLEIVRVPEFDERNAKSDEIVYDIGWGKFDHHQPGRKMAEPDVPYSAFGLLWQAYGRELLELQGFSRIEEAHKLFAETIARAIDVGDNKGYKNVKGFYENLLICRFAPLWYELPDGSSEEDLEQIEKVYNRQFWNAVDFTTLLFDNWMRDLWLKVEVADEEKRIWEEALYKLDRGVIELPRYIPWRQHLDATTDIKLVIVPNERGGYAVTSVDTTVIRLRPNPHLTFVHPSGFMATAPTLEDARAAAHEIIK